MSFSTPAAIRTSPSTGRRKSRTCPQYALGQGLNVHVPEDIKYVIISHLHVDHAGCLKFFRNARVFVNDAEFTTTVRQYALGQGLNVHVPEDIRGFIEAKLNWRLVAENEVEVEVVPGVTVVNFGSGHSWGMMGMKVELANSGNFLMVADAIYMRDNVEPEISVPGISGRHEQPDGRA